MPSLSSSRASSAINRVLVRKSIIVRMGTPRFLRQGDEVTIPVIVHNYLDQPSRCSCRSTSMVSIR